MGFFTYLQGDDAAELVRSQSLSGWDGVFHSGDRKLGG